MDLISRVRQRAEQALKALQQQAESEGWDTARVEKEKQLFQLRHEVTICSSRGCLALVEAIPGFRELYCDRCQEAKKT